MPVERFFFPDSLISDQQLAIEGSEFHHLVNVTRVKINEKIEIVNGLGDLAIGHVLSIGKKQALVSIDEVTSKPASPTEVILAQAIPRLNRLDFIVEKGTELGMTQLWLFPGKRSERKEFTPSQQERLHTVTVAAMKQCGRLYLPKIILMPSLKKWQAPQYSSFFGDVDPAAPKFSQMRQQNASADGLIFFIGPESGFDEEEISLFKLWNARGVKLNDNILRTDTAALAALSVITC